LYGIFLFFAVELFAEERATVEQPDPREIIRRTAATFERDIGRSPEHTFQQRAVTQEFDRNGKIRETRSRTHEAVILFDRRYMRLIAIEDEPRPFSAGIKSSRSMKINTLLISRF
jgi:hypothetical protein